MKLYCVGDERYPYFYLSEDVKDFYEPYMIELTAEEYEKFQAASAEAERWQDLLEDKVNKARQKCLLENTKNGIKPKGFN